MANPNFKVTRAQDGKAFAGKTTTPMVKGTLVRTSPSSVANKPGVFDDAATLILADGISRAGLLERDVIAGTTIPLAQLLYGDDVLTSELVGAYVAGRNVQEYEVEGSELIQTTGPQALSSGTPLDVELTTQAGKVALRGDLSDLTISGNTAANPTVVTTSTAHGLTTGQTVTISGSNSTPSLNGPQVVTVLTTTTFSVPVNVSVAGTAGTLKMPKREIFGWLRGQLAPLDSGNFRLLVEVAE